MKPGLLALMQSEWERVWARKKTKVSMILFVILLLLECVFLWMMGGISFYSAEQSVYLNSLNAAPFLLREMAIFINMIVIPMLAADSFNGEYTSGALRNVLLRPLPRWKLVTAKWVVMAVLLLIMTALMMVTGIVFGLTMLPPVMSVSFLNTSTLGFAGAMGYTLMFYGTAYLVFLAVMGISAILSTLLPNAILAYMATIGVIIGGMYFIAELSFLFSAADDIFKRLGGLHTGADLIVISILCAIITFIGVQWIWNKRSYLA